MGCTYYTSNPAGMQSKALRQPKQPMQRILSFHREWPFSLLRQIPKAVDAAQIKCGTVSSTGIGRTEEMEET